MRRNAFVVWSVVLLLAAVVLAGATVLGVQAQDEETVYLPLLSLAPGGPVIQYFRANVEIADPGETIQLAWASTGGVEADLARIERGGPYAEFWDVALTGAFTYTVPSTEREYVQFQLTVLDAEGRFTSAGLTVPLTCPDTWFFEPAPDGCPGDAALFSLGAEQPFEHGVMVWVEGRDGIFVLFEDASNGEWAFYEDTWEEGDTLCDRGPVPPGLYQPQRGFGTLWCEEPGLFERLGWATAFEVGYDTAVQHDSAPKYTTTYLRAADGDVWKLLPWGSGWEKIFVTGP